MAGWAQVALSATKWRPTTSSNFGPLLSATTSSASSLRRRSRPPSLTTAVCSVWPLEIRAAGHQRFLHPRRSTLAAATVRRRVNLRQRCGNPPAASAKEILQNLLDTTTVGGGSFSPTKAHVSYLGQWARRTDAKQSEAPRDDRTSWFNRSVISDSYRQLALAFCRCTILW